MQRWCSKLRLLSAIHSKPKAQLSFSYSPHRLLHSSPNLLLKPRTFTSFYPNFNPPFNTSLASQLSVTNYTPILPPSFMQVRYLTLKQRKRKLKSRRPTTPVVSKLKKTKMKFYSSYKDRFRTMNDGKIRRWKEGKRHNAHLKSKEAKRRLRQPGIVPAAYAKVMKKLSFCS